jgi:predicted transposase YdaD
MAEMDQGIKRLLQTHPADILALALPGVEYVEPMPAEVATEPQLLMDTLFRVRYEGVECAVNVEAQLYPDPTMPRRCFEYGSRVSVVSGLPALSVVLWLERRGAVPKPPYEMRVGSWLQATWQFINIEMYELSAREALENAHPGLLPLVPFMRESDLTVIESAARIVKERSAPAEASELASLLAVFGSRRYGNDAMRALIRRLFMSTEVLDTSPLYREWVEKAQAEGEAKGMAEGEAKGMAEGEAKGLRESVRTVLEARFQTVDAELIAAITAADTATLRDALRYVALDSVDEIRDRLRRRPE